MRNLFYHLLVTAALVLAGTAIERALTSGSRSSAAFAAHAPKSATTTATTTSAHTGATNANKATTSAKAATPQQCVQCHDEQVASYGNTTHSHAWKDEKSCEQCHGDVAKHVETGGAPGTIVTMKGLSANEASKTCLNCHTRSGEQSHSQLSEHMRAGVGCTTCHDVHPSNDHKAEMHNVGKFAMLRGKQTELCLSCHNQVSADFNKPVHHRLKEGIVECTSCHNPHGSDQDHQLRADTKTLCVKCHQDKRGPFVYEHNAQALDGCMACHDSHGSGARNMLKMRDPRALCVSCHSREMASAAPGSSTNAGVPHSRGNFSLQTTGDCTRCHATIHGSNRNQYFTE